MPISLDDLAYLLTALAEGLALRVIAEKDARVVDHDIQRSLFGTAALALVLGCMQRSDDPEGITIEQAVRAFIHEGRPDASSSSDGAPSPRSA
jgi:hypothetical protein